MPTKLNNINFFILQDRYSSVSRPLRVRGILRTYLRVDPRSLFRVTLPTALQHRTDNAEPFLRYDGTLKEGPEHCHHYAYS